MPRRLILVEHGIYPHYLIATACVAIGGVLRLSLDSFTAIAPRTTFIPMIMLAALIGGWGPGIYTILLSFAVSAIMLGITRGELFTINAVIFFVMTGSIVALAAAFRYVHFLELQQSEQLQAAINHRDMLMAEMDHRVGNILAITSAVLRLEDDPRLNNAKRKLLRERGLEDIQRIAEQHQDISLRCQRIEKGA